MNLPASEELIKEIASETHEPMETVSKMYEETWAAYSEGAHIMDYLTVLVARRVRENIRDMHKNAH
jgi:hypothetical protein